MDESGEIAEKLPGADYLQGNKDARFMDGETRASYWAGEYQRDLNDQHRQNFNKQAKEARQFMEKKIEEILQAEGVAFDKRTYWYKGTFTSKIFRFLKGGMFQAPWKVVFKEDSLTGANYTPLMREAADMLTDDFNNDEVIEECGDCHDDYYAVGMGGLRNRVERHIFDRRTGKLKVVTERTDPDKLIIDRSAYRFRDARRVFYGERLPVETIKGMFPEAGEISPDRWQSYEKGYETDSQISDGCADLIQVQYWRNEPAHIYRIPEELAAYMNIPQLLSAGEMQRLSVHIRETGRQQPELAAGLKVMWANSDSRYSFDRVWYQDVICNGRSLVGQPLPLIGNGNEMGISPCDYNIAKWMKLQGSCYGAGLVYEMKDELVLAILALTALVRQIIQLEGDWVFVNTAAFTNGDEVAAAMKEGPGVVAVSSDLDSGEDLRKHIFRFKRDDDVTTQVLGIVDYMLGRVEDQGGGGKAQTGRAEFAGVAASLQGLLQVRSSLQNLPGELGFKRLINRTVKHRAVLYKELGIFKPELPLHKLEAAIDTRSKEERDSEGLKIIKYVEAGLADRTRFWDEMGWDDGPERAMAEEKMRIGETVMNNPEMMMMIKQEANSK